MARRRRSKWAKSERNRLEAPFAPFPCEMIESAAFRSLSGSALKILFHLTTVWARSGGIVANTNGRLVATYERFHRFWGMDLHTAAAAMRQLIALGFIERKSGSSGNADEFEPSTYRLTFLPAEGISGTGSNEWKRIAPEDAKRVASEAQNTPGDGPRRVRRVTDVTDKSKNPVGVCHRFQGENSRGAVTFVTDVTAVPRWKIHRLYRSRPEGQNEEAPHAHLSPRRSRGDDCPLNRADPLPGSEGPCPSALPAVGSSPALAAAPLGRAVRLGPPQCEVCGDEVRSRRNDARFCSAVCRKRAHRRRDRLQGSVR